MSGSNPTTAASRKQPPWRVPEAKPVPKLKLYNSMTRSKVNHLISPYQDTPPKPNRTRCKKIQLTSLFSSLFSLDRVHPY